MPPRYAYWTILIDNTPTAFRAKEQSELLPTLHQLQRTNKDVVLKWYSHGRVWDSPEAARQARESRGTGRTSKQGLAARRRTQGSASAFQRQKRRAPPGAGDAVR